MVEYHPLSLYAMTQERAPYHVDRLKDYHVLTTKLLAAASKPTLEYVARILALHVGFYQRRYGHLPLDNALAGLLTDSPTQEQIGDMTEGLEMLSAVLALA